MAKPISNSYPVTGLQAKELIQEIERTNQGEVNFIQKNIVESNMKKALYFFHNAESILSNKK